MCKYILSSEEIFYFIFLNGNCMAKGIIVHNQYENNCLAHVIILAYLSVFHILQQTIQKWKKSNSYKVKVDFIVDSYHFVHSSFTSSFSGRNALILL